MINPFLSGALALAGLGGGIAKHQALMKQRARPAYDKTEEGRWLQNRMMKGGFDVSQRLQPFATDVFTRTGEEQAGAQGRFVRSGMEQSGAASQMIAKIGMEGTGQVGRERGRLTDINQQIMDEARGRYSSNKTQWNEERRREQQALDVARRENIVSTITGMVPLVGKAVGNFINSRYPKKGTGQDYSGIKTPAGGGLDPGYSVDPRTWGKMQGFENLSAGVGEGGYELLSPEILKLDKRKLDELIANKKLNALNEERVRKYWMNGGE